MRCVRPFRDAWVAAIAAAIALTALFAMTSQPVLADQNDPRLDRLFAVLHTSSDERELDAAQNQIWEIWIETEDDDAAQLMRLGIFAMSQSRNEDALKFFDALIELEPNFAEAWNKRATLYYLMGDLDRSAADVERTLELEPRHFGAFSGLGQIELLRGDREAALKAFEHALDTNPHMPGARRMIEQLERRNTGNSL